jgi:xanthine/CO dehydrogenase XdhC/CoxF family maturation factor
VNRRTQTRSILGREKSVLWTSLRPPDLCSQMAELSAKGECPATITIIGNKGFSPRRLGAKMIVREDGSRTGNVRGDRFENDTFDMVL